MSVKVPVVRPTGNRDQDVFQREVREGFQGLKDDPFLSFTTKTNVQIDSTATKIAHGLGRVPNGWILTDIRFNTRVWRVSWDSNFITLQAGAPVTVSLRFF